ncbi:phosphodiester glycosidase family protein [Nonomuraea zeae]|nr:phosphodiester glycosidase family protein [Nonomuraea zeae]
MLITEENAVTFQLVTQATPDYPESETYTAIAGGPQPNGGGGWPPQPQLPAQPLLLVENGANQATPEQSPVEEVAGRTGVGLSADGQYLYLVTLDGCENTAQQFRYGGGYYDIAQWLIIAGAKALNLATTVVTATPARRRRAQDGGSRINA